MLSREREPVILLDELGRLRDADIDANPNVFEWLRSLGQFGAVLVLAGAASDWEEVQARDAEKPGSSFANIFKSITLGPLTKLRQSRF